MNWFDFVLLGLLAVYVISGYSQGLLKQLIGLLGFFIALLVAFYGSRSLSGLVAGHLNPESLLPVQEAAKILGLQATLDWIVNMVAGVITFLVLFFVTQLLLHFLAGGLVSFNRIPVVGFFNRLGGAALGLLKGLILAIILISVASLLPVDFMVQATGGSLLVALSNQYLPLATEALKELFLKLYGQAFQGAGGK